MSTHVTFLLSRFQQYCQSRRSQVVMYPPTWHWRGAPVVSRTCFCHVTEETPDTFTQTSQGTRCYEVSRGDISQRNVYIILRNNEIIYNLYKKFLLDGDRFLWFHSTPTLHPGSWSGSSESFSSSGRVVVVLFCVGESPDFGGCWVVDWWRFLLVLLR